MTRNNMIEILTESYIEEITGAPVTAVENNLIYYVQEAGITPLNSLKDKELRDMIKNFDEKIRKDYLEKSIVRIAAKDRAINKYMKKIKFSK